LLPRVPEEQKEEKEEDLKRKGRRRKRRREEEGEKEENKKGRRRRGRGGKRRKNIESLFESSRCVKFRKWARERLVVLGVIRAAPRHVGAS
jgi:hypothetical protein